jgi:hypothetical protein
MPRWWAIAPVGVAAILTTSCGTAAPSGQSATSTDGTDAPVSMRPTASDDSIALLGGGKSLRDMSLSNVYIPAVGRQGTVVEIHPTAQPLVVQAVTLPSGGRLLVCPVNVFGSGGSWARTTQPCIPVTSTARISVKLDEADGNTHVAMEFDGTWKGAVTIKSVQVSYTAVDDHFYIDFAVR